MKIIILHLVFWGAIIACMQGFSPFATARFFIEESRPENGLTPMKLIKLAYIAHGWHLAFFDKPLLSETVQAWKYGPVIESLYHGFKQYGNELIPKSELSCLQDLSSDFIETSRPLLVKVWEKYGGLSGLHLSALTHQPGTPWYEVWYQDGGKDKKCAQIPDQIIQKFYRQKLDSPTGSGH